MKTFSVTADVTISLYARVRATSEKDALHRAGLLAMPTIRDDSKQNSDGENETWSTSGELDGEAYGIKVDE